MDTVDAAETAAASLAAEAVTDVGCDAAVEAAAAGAAAGALIRTAPESTRDKKVDPWPEMIPARVSANII